LGQLAGILSSKLVGPGIGRENGPYSQSRSTVHGMRTVDPNGVIDDFEDLVDESLADWIDVAAAISAQPVALRRKVATDAFLSVAVGWESFLSDWWTAAINKDASTFLSQVESALRNEAAARFGLEASDLANKLISRSHLNVNQVRRMLDPNDRNIVIHGYRDLSKRAKAELAGQYQTKATGIASHDWQIAEATRMIRNALAHRSKSAIDAMNQLLRKNSIPLGLRWTGQRNLNIAGTMRYLDTHRPADVDSRVKVYHDRLKSLAAQLRIP
jgi:hypothetical protein